MLTRFAIFAGRLKPGCEAEMRGFVDTVMAPLWAKFDCAEEVRVYFGVEQEANGPVVPLILAISYADRAAMQKGITSPARDAAKERLPELYERFFEEIRLNHYVMDRAILTG